MTPGVRLFRTLGEILVHENCEVSKKHTEVFYFFDKTEKHLHDVLLMLSTFLN